MAAPVSRNDIILGLVALVLVVFSLAVSLLIPRRDPGFPGRNLRVFTVVAILLVVAMLAAVEVLGEAHESEGESGPPETTATGVRPGETGETETGGGGAGGGDPAAGKSVFASAGCDSCHALADAGSSAAVGPDLDESLQGRDAAFIRESIVNPDAQVAEGFAPGVMPGNYEEQLGEDELANLVAYLAQFTGG